MGIVYKATQLSLARPVAIKTLLPDRADPGSLARFRREALTLRTVEHPNVVRVLDVELDTEPAYLVLELVSGARTLVEMLEEPPATPGELVDRITLLRSILEGLTAAHQLDVVHRDLKPANILVTADGVPKLIDFGLARSLSAFETRQTRDGQLMGTLAYMSPEQLRGEEVGLATDVYSFALVACEVVARRLLFGASGAGRISYGDRLATGVPDVRRWNEKVDPRLALLLGRCLQDGLDGRPASASAVLGAWPAAAGVQGTGADRTEPIAVLTDRARQAPPAPSRRPSAKTHALHTKAVPVMVRPAVREAEAHDRGPRRYLGPAIGLLVAGVSFGLAFRQKTSAVAVIPQRTEPTPQTAAAVTTLRASATEVLVESRVLRCRPLVIPGPFRVQFR